MEPIFGTWVCLELSEKKWLPTQTVEGWPWGTCSSINHKTAKRCYSSFLFGRKKKSLTHVTQNRIPYTLRPFFRPLSQGIWNGFAFASSHVAKNCASNISTLGQTWSLDYGTLKAMCTVHSAPGDQTLCACSVSILLFRRGSWTE